MRRLHTSHALRRFLRSAALLILATAAALALAPKRSEATVPPPHHTAFDSNDFVFITHGVESGMPSDHATAILAAADGYLWIGTDAGLVRFDGNRFTVFRTSTTPELPDDAITALAEDEHGTLWFGTAAGLASRQQDRFFRHPEIDVAVTDFSRDPHGRLWFSTHGRGLWEIRDGHLIPHEDHWVVPIISHTEHIHHDSRGRLWIAPAGGGLAYIDANDKLRLQADLAMDSPQILAMAEDGRGRMWFSTPRQLWHETDRGIMPLTLDTNSVTGIHVVAMRTDGGDRLWAAGDRLYRIDLDAPDTARSVSPRQRRRSGDSPHPRLRGQPLDRHLRPRHPPARARKLPAHPRPARPSGPRADGRRRRRRKFRVGRPRKRRARSPPPGPFTGGDRSRRRTRWCRSLPPARLRRQPVDRHPGRTRPLASRPHRTFPRGRPRARHPRKRRRRSLVRPRTRGPLCL
ncbi:MAG: hypothetical protein D6781_06580 [Verrucomicrobia bacterium]|nr:MAG: hypothetical protein D6781_06580 [Verrucomicrobiota bacterium]